MSLSNIKVNNSTVTGVDNEPTAGSDNLVKSGGTDSFIGNLIGGFQLFTIDNVIIYASNGSQQTSSNYKCTDFIELVGISSVIIKNANGSSTGAAIYFYDENKTPIENSGVPLNSTFPNVFEVTVPDNAKYFRSCTVNTSEFVTINLCTILDLYIYKAEKSDVDLLKIDNNTNKGILQAEYTDEQLPTREDNGYWGINGVYYESSGWRTTIPIKVSVGDYIFMSVAGTASNLTVVSQNGEYFKTLIANSRNGIVTSTYSFNFEGYVAISYRATEGLTYKLYKSKVFREIADFIDFKGCEVLFPELKSPNGYWGSDRNYYETDNYRTSTPIEVKIGDKLEVTAAGTVSIITRVYYDGRYMSTILNGTSTTERHLYTYTSTFNGYVAISYRFEEKLYLTITRAKKSQDNGSLSGIKWGAMGDSFTDPITLSGQPDTRNYVDLIAEQTGLNVINYGKSGSGYKAREAQNQAFYQVALTVDSNLDVITIFGSGNDQNWVTLEQIGNAIDTGTETLCGCMNTAIDNLISVNPCIRIGLVTPTPWRNYPPDSTTATWMLRYSEKIVEVAALRGIPCLDLYHDSNLRPWNAEALTALYIDNGHPNTEGHKRIASQIKAFLIEMAG